MLRFGLPTRAAATAAAAAASTCAAAPSAEPLTPRRLAGSASPSSTTPATSTPGTSNGAAAGRQRAARSLSSATPSPTGAAHAPGSARSGVHKFSEDKAEASAYAGADDVPSYSATAHTGYLLLHSRRLWLPLLLYGGYAALAAYLTPVQAGLYATASIVAQRLSVHGRSNAIRKDMHGYTCVVTGGTSGIGLYTAMQLLDMGARVIIAAPPGKEAETMEFFVQNCRPSAARAPAAESAASAAPASEPLEKRVTFIAMDYMDQLEVMAAAARIKALVNDRIDLLVNCAGVWKEEPTVTKQKFEEHIGVNFLGPFHFTEALLPSLRKSPHRCGRIVYVTCASHNGVSRANVVRERMQLLPGPHEAQVTARCYSASKLGNIYHAQSLANRRYEGIPVNRQSDLHPVDVCCADPGFCFTLLQQENATPFLGNNVIARSLRSLWIKDAYEGSQTVVSCCVRDTVENGGYYAECTLMPSGLSKRAQDPKSRDEVVHWAMAKTIAKYYTVRSE